MIYLRITDQFDALFDIIPTDIFDSVTIRKKTAERSQALFQGNYEDEERNKQK